MKTFSDPQTIIQQEQRRTRLKRRVEILRQFAGAITARNSATEIVLDGDATALLAAGDTFIIALHDFEENHVITDISYDGGGDETTVTCDASTFSATGLPGLHAAKRYTVSGGDEERLIEMTPIRYQIEREVLSGMMASDVDLLFANDDGFFANSSATGLFDNSDVLWLRIYAGWQNASDRVLVFGGLVQKQESKDDRYKKTFMLTAFGHAKELERYPAYLLSEPFGDFLKLSGVTLVGVTANSKTFAGVKTLEWNFRTKQIPGVEILSLSKNLNGGLVPLKFRFPNFFKFAYGDWTAVNENTASQDLTGADGSVLTIKTTNYDVQDREVFLVIVNDLNARVDKSGELEVIFDNGLPLKVVTDWDAIINYTGVNFYDETSFSDREGYTLEPLLDGAAELYLFSKEPFYGFELDLDSSDLSGTLAFEFSNGLNSWQSFSPTDGTSNFTQSGVVTWNAGQTEGWRAVIFEQTGIDAIPQKFGIRISFSSYTSGSPIVRALRRYYQVLAANGTGLSLRVNFHEAPAENVREDVIVREISGTWTPCTWYRNVTLQKIVALILQEANYGTGAYTLEDMKLSFDTARLNLIGQAPAPFYQKKCKALLWDSGNEILYLGIGDELWKVTESGDFTFIDKLQKLNENDDGYGLVDLSIRSLALDSGTINGMAWWDKYEDGVVHKADFYSSFYTWFFKSDGAAITGTLAASGGEQASSPQYIHPGERMIRKGGHTSDWNSIGVQTGFFDHGENIIIPLTQVLRNYIVIGVAHLLNGKDTLLGSNVTDPLFNFGYDPLTTNNNQFFKAAPDYFHVSDQQLAGDFGWFKLKWQLGNSGLHVYSAGNGFLCYKMERTESSKTDTNARIGKISVDQAFASIYNFSDTLYQPLCAFVQGGDLYLAFMLWDDGSANPSTCVLAKIGIASGTKTDLFDFSTDSAEAGQSITGDEAYMTVLDMAYNAEENTIHGCLLNRNNFEYHWFVYDVAEDKLYSTQTGSGFTFDKHRQHKDFCYFNEKIHAVCVDKRYQTAPCFLVEAAFASGTITLTRVNTIDESWDHLTTHATADAIWGVTGSGKLWKYGTSFYPRVAHADFGRMNFGNVLNACCEVLNRVAAFRANRNVRIVERTSYDGSKTLFEDVHIAALNPLLPSEHVYDRVEVKWSDPASGQSGLEAFGVEAWENRVLTISNGLIQDRQLAAAVAEAYYEHFSTPRNTVQGDLICMLELEELDRVKFIVKQNRTDLSRDDYYLINEMNLDLDEVRLSFKAIE